MTRGPVQGDVTRGAGALWAETCCPGPLLLTTYFCLLVMLPGWKRELFKHAESKWNHVPLQPADVGKLSSFNKF